MDVEFQDIHFSVGSDLIPWNRGPKREILKGVSGCFRSGELSAILGPSGAGKTSLLNAISGYKTAGVEGRLLLNGQPRDERKFRKMSCYITQEDLLIPMLTLGELMQFASSLKLPPAYTRKQKRFVVEEIQNMLRLTEAKDTVTEHLSGGQRKRLSIALELINNPPILFLDEPTSGLDNVAATNLIELLNSLSRGGRTVVCTIHQPSAKLLTLFDLVYFVGDGKCVYQGGPGPHLLSFLTELKLPCPEYYNPADYLIELLEEPDKTNILAQASKNGQFSWFCKEHLQPIKPKAVCEKGAGAILDYGRISDEGKSRDCNSQKFSFWIQFSTLISRMFLQQKRNKTALQIQLYHHIGCALAIGVMFHNKGNDGNEFFNHLKFCMGVILFHTYTWCMTPILSYPFEVKLLKKEHFNQWYRLFPYYMAFTAAKIPLMVFLNQLFNTIIYALSGLPWEWQRFLAFSVVGNLTAFIAEGMGLTIGSIFSVTNGAAVGPLSIAPFLGFAIYGFDFARSISPLMTPLVRTSFMRGAVVALVLVVFGMDRQPLDCDDPVYCHFQDPKVTLHYLFLENDTIWDYLRDIFIILSVFRIAFYLGLKWRLRT